jgi:RimJ/RimL family protein N-acetyltransferase
VLEAYHPGHFSEIKSFAERQPEFDYLLGIIRAHTREHVPGGVWVWREEPGPGVRGQGSVVAVCGMALLNRRDAWLYGMRVDPRFRNTGVATRLTRALFRLARQSGRTWIGLDTLNHPRKAPVFRIAEKLGMKLEGIYATAGFSDLPEPRDQRNSECGMQISEFRERTTTEDSEDHRGHRGKLNPCSLCSPCCFLCGSVVDSLRNRHSAIRNGVTGTPEGEAVPKAQPLNPAADWTGGEPVMFHEQYPRWLWSRVGLARGSVLPDGSPVQIVRRRYRGRLRTSINLLAEPDDLTSTLAELLRFAAGRGRSLVINYPAVWTSRLRAAARRLGVPKPKRFFVAWRIYGRRLKRPVR